MRSLIRGCVTPRRSAARFWVRRLSRIYCSSSTMSIARNFKLAASSAPNPKSRKTLFWLRVSSYIPLVAQQQLKPSICCLDRSLRSLSRLLLKGMQDVDGFRQRCQIDDPVLVVTVDSYFLYATTHTGHRLPIRGLHPRLNLEELIPGVALSLCRPASDSFQ